MVHKSELSFLSELHNSSESVVSRGRIIAFAVEISDLTKSLGNIFRCHAVGIEESSLNKNKIT